MRGSASAQVVVPLQEGGQRNTFPGLGQSEGQPGVRKDFDPEGRRLCVSLGGYVANSYCKSGEGALYLLYFFLVLSMRSAFAGMTFMLFFATLLRTTDSDIRAT